MPFTFIRCCLSTLLASVFLFNLYAASPVVTSTAVTTATEDSSYSYSLTGTDTDTNDVLDWEVTSGTTLPSWLSLGSGSTTPNVVADTGGGQLGGMAIDAGGNIYATQLSGSSIYKFDNTGNLSTWATVTDSSSKYGMIVVDDYLYIAYYSLGKITRVSLSNPSAGESDWVTGLSSSGPLSMHEENGDLYVAMNIQDNIKINMTTKAIEVTATANRAFGITKNSSGNLHFASVTADTIIKYDNGTSTNVYDVDFPTDIKFDANDNLYISTYRGGLVKLNSDYTFAANITTDTSRIWGMSIDANGTLAWGDATGQIYKLETGATLSGTPTNDDVGIHSVDLTLTDGTNDTNHAFQITVANTNDAPVLASSDNLNYTENNTSTLDSGITVSDVDADAVGLGANITISANFFSAEDTLAFTDADGITSSWDSTNGILALSGNATPTQYQTALRSITYSNASDNPSSNTRLLTWSYTDGIAYSTNITSSINITTVNDAPTITSTATTTGAEGSAYSYSPTATDPESDTLTWSLTTSPTGMTIDANTGVIAWTPTSGTNADNEGVVISVTDGNATDTQSYTIISTGFNETPVISWNGNIISTFGDNIVFTMDEDGVYTSPVPTATDAEGDDITWGTFVYNVVENGTLTVSGTGASPTINYTPNANFFGTDDFTLTALDPSGGGYAPNVYIVVNPVNDAPVINGGNASLDASLSEDSTLTLSSANITFSDIENDAATWTISTNALHGNVITLSTSGNDISTVSYQPNANYTGSDNFTLTVSDGTDTDTLMINLTIDPVNDAPTITEESVAVTMDEDGSFTAPSLTVTEIDENDTLNWSVSTPAISGTATVTGTGSSPVINYTPNLHHFGSDNFVLTVSDGALSDSVTVHVTITAVNDAPVVQTPSAISLAVDETLSLTLDASDVDTTDTLSVRFMDGGRDWISLDGLQLSGTVPAYEAGQALELRLGISDGSVTTETFVSINIAALPEEELTETLTSSTTDITVLSTAGSALENAAVKVFGQQLRYTDAAGVVSISLPQGISTELSFSADGYEPASLVLDGSESSASISLTPAPLTLSGTITLGDSASPLGAVVAAMGNVSGNILSLETEVNGDGTYSLSLPQATTTWTLGASLEGYAQGLDTLDATSADTALSWDVTLNTESQFSWRSNQASFGDNISVSVTSFPSFSANDATTAQVDVDAAGVTVSDVSFDTSDSSLNFTVTPAASSENIALTFTAQPTGGQVKVLDMLLAVAQEGDAKQNLHFFQRFSSASGTRGSVSLSGLDEESEDLSGIEVPAFGVSANVDAIRMERVQETVTNITTASPIYSIDAYSINATSGDLSLVGNSEITEIFLTFSYDPTLWNPLTQFVSFSEDNGLTWENLSRDDIVAVDPLRLTVTVRTSHLSLWTLSSSSDEGLFGISGGSTGGGGGCILKTGGLK